MFGQICKVVFQIVHDKATPYITSNFETDVWTGEYVHIWRRQRNLQCSLGAAAAYMNMALLPSHWDVLFNANMTAGHPTEVVARNVMVSFHSGKSRLWIYKKSPQIKQHFVEDRDSLFVLLSSWVWHVQRLTTRRDRCCVGFAWWLDFPRWIFISIRSHLPTGVALKQSSHEDFIMNHDFFKSPDRLKIYSM